MTQMERVAKDSELSEARSFDGEYADLTERIIGCAFKVHNELGPGFV